MHHRRIVNSLTDLDLCTDAEKIILIAIAALAKSLPNPSPHYMKALGDITRRFTTRGGGHRGDHNPSPGSLAQTHEVVATEKWR